MYQVYITKETGFNRKQLMGEFADLNDANEKIETELAKDKDLKYIIEETTGKVDIYGELVVNVIAKN